jgi:hypothetical protein
MARVLTGALRKMAAHSVNKMASSQLTFEKRKSTLKCYWGTNSDENFPEKFKSENFPENFPFFYKDS